MHTGRQGGLGLVLLGSGAAATYRDGGVDGAGFDGHSVGAAGGVFGVGDVSCGDDVDRWAWGGPICMTESHRTCTLRGRLLFGATWIRQCLVSATLHKYNYVQACGSSYKVRFHDSS